MFGIALDRTHMESRGRQARSPKIRSFSAELHAHESPHRRTAQASKRLEGRGRVPGRVRGLNDHAKGPTCRRVWGGKGYFSKGIRQRTRACRNRKGNREVKPAGSARSKIVCRHSPAPGAKEPESACDNGKGDRGTGLTERCLEGHSSSPTEQVRRGGQRETRPLEKVRLSTLFKGPS